MGEKYSFASDFPSVAEFCNPEFKELDAVDSSDLTPADWTTLAETIVAESNDYDGFVVLQGTDTLEFTSYALSFATAGLKKPVVITGAQLPKHNPASDAQANVVNACRVAAWKARNGAEIIAAVPGVSVVFGSYIIRGTRCRKYSERDLDAFRSINAPPLGRVQLELTLSESALEAPNSPRRHIDAIHFNEDVALLTLYPGMDPELILDLGRKSSGVVLSAYGAGNIPSASTRVDNPHSLVEPIRTLTAEDIPVCLTTRCVVGAAEMGMYEAGSAAEEAGAIILNDMLSEVAYVKLAWVLANKDAWPRNAQRALEGGPGFIGAVRKAMIHPVAGEITSNKKLRRMRSS